VNGYLVIIRGSSNDIPVSLHVTWDEAETAARRVAADPNETLARMEIDWPSPLHLSHIVIVTFSGGRPIKSRAVGFDET
jgi:hypothetical protein